jgi:hypothetical protein
MTWNFTVWGCDANGSPKCLGKTETYEEAVKFKANMVTAGWNRVAVFDVALQEVKEKPKAGKLARLSAEKEKDYTPSLFGHATQAARRRRPVSEESAKAGK